MMWTDKSLRLSFGIATAVGVVIGAALWSLATGKFRLEGFASLDDLRQQLLGAVLMGFGGVTAMGCTIGQGLTGLSTLAIGSFIAVGVRRIARLRDTGGAGQRSRRVRCAATAARRART